MATNYSPELVTDGAVFVGDAASSLATPALDLDVLIVAGGGGGGYALGGGGGGGGVVHLTNANVSKGTYAVVVGAGGISDENGSNSTIFGATAAGGGGGDGYADASGNSGGCGGGAGSALSGNGVGGAATGSSLGTRTGTIYGNKGGNQTAARAGDPTSARAGGGAGAAGADEAPSTTDGGTGGAGIQINIDGNNYYWAGGGGGAAYTSYAGGAGGLGGGGGGSSNGTGVGAGGTGGLNNGATPTITSIGGVAGTNTGSGGGGGAWSSYAGGAGGSGIVIIRLAAKNNLGVATAITTLSGKSYTAYTSGGVSYYVWTYTASGNFTIPHSLLVDRAGGNSGMMYNGSCLTFDGSDDHVTFSSIGTTYEESLTITAWVKTGNTDGWRDILGGGCGDIIFGVSSTDNGTLSFGGQCNDPFVPLAGTTNIADDAWHFVCATYDGSTAKIYVDGALDSSASKSGAIDGDTTKSWGGNGSSESWDGELADCRIYDVTLSLQNIVEIYNDSKVIIPSNISQSNLLQHLTFAEGAGIICYDGSGNGNDGTMTNMDAVDWLTGQTGCPQLVEGYNRPMSFDGSNDYVDITDGLTSGTNPVSISVWCNGIAGNSYYPAWRVGNAITAGLCIHGALNRIEGGAGASDTFDNSSFGNSLVDGAWHHILVTYDGSEIRKYEDGVYISGATFSSYGTWTAADGLGSETNTTIGSFWSGYFKGMINEFIVYDATLVAADAAILAATGPNGGPLPPDPYGMSYSAGISSSNIVGYWRNDGSVTWTDRSGNGNTGTVTGSPEALLFKQGYNGSASASTGRDNQGFPLKFKNVGAVGFANYIANTATTGVPIGDTIITSGGVNAGSDGSFSVSAWVNAEKLSTTLSVVNKRTQNGSWPCFDISVGTSGQIICNYSSTTYGQCLETYTTGAGLIEKNKWYYVLFVKPAGSASVNYLDVKIYVNGVSVTWTNSLYGGHLYSNTVATSTEPMYIGRFLDGSSATGNWTNPFRGQLGPVHVYNRTLSYAEIQQNYNAQRSRFT
jgi:hypothetical protein